MTWKADVLSVIRNHWSVGEPFTLTDLYRFEEALIQAHPENRNVRPKIRQALQDLRDNRMVEFVDDGGTYRLR
jgi:type II restriction enzyme